MTLDEFFEKLPRDGWRLFDGREIVRANDNGCCPWLWVSRNHDDQYQEARAVWDAADKKPGHDKKLRARLLAHCGLTEVRKPREY